MLTQRAGTSVGTRRRRGGGGSQGPTPVAGPLRAGVDRSSAVATPIGAQTQPERDADTIHGLRC